MTKQKEVVKKAKKATDKTPELTKAKKALEAYLKSNNLDPTKDWTKDKTHGKMVTELVNKLNKERDKVAIKFPEGDIKNEAKLVKMRYNAIKAKKIEAEAKAEAKAKPGTKKYDYPKVDGREMTPDEKRKYRAAQRKLAKSNNKPAKSDESKLTAPVNEED